MSGTNNIIIEFLNKLSLIVSQFKTPTSLSPDRKKKIRETIKLIQNVCNEHTKSMDFSQITKNSKDHIESITSLKNAIENYFEGISKVPILISAADTYTNMGELHLAKSIYDELIDFLSGLNTSQYIPDIKLRLGRVHALQTNWDIATLYFKESLELFEQLSDYQNQIQARTELANVYFKQGNYKTAFKLYNKSLEQSIETKNNRNIAYLKNRIGVINRIKDQRNISLDMLNHSAKLFRELNDVQGMVESLNELAMAHLQLSNYEKSINYLNECIEICNRFSDHNLLAFVNLNKALFYLEVDDYPKSVEFCTEGLNLLIKTDNALGLPKVASILAHTFQNYRQNNIAGNLFEESICLYQELNIPLGLANSCLDYAKMLDETDNHEQAIKHLVMAKEIFDTMELKKKSENVSEEIKKIKYAHIFEEMTASLSCPEQK